MAIYVLAEGLQLTGITDKVGSLLLKLAGSEKRWLMVTVMISGAFLSLFMNNIAAASVLMPAVSGASRKSEINPSRLLMPLAIGTILGGMATLLTTANIIVSSLLRDAGYTGFGLLDFAPAWITLRCNRNRMATVGWRLLPKRSSIRQHHTMHQEEGDLGNIYRLDERLIIARFQWL